MEKEFVEQVDRLLEIREIRNLYYKKIHLLNNPAPFYKAFFLKEVIVRLAQGMEIIDSLSEKCNKAESRVIKAKDSLIIDSCDREERFKQLSRLIDDFKASISEIFDTVLRLHKEGRLVLREIDDNDHDIKEHLLEVANSQLYQSFRNVLAERDFKIEEGEKWPVADLSNKNRSLRAIAIVRPDPERTLISSSEQLTEWQSHMSEKVMAMDDLTADVFDIVTGKWLREASHYEAMVNVTVDDFLKIRGLRPKPGGSGGRGGYGEKQRKTIARHIDALSYTWIIVQEMDIVEVINGKRKRSRWRQESRALVLSSRFGKINSSGAVEAYAWRARPGDIFTKFLFGPGRQTALLSQKALQYDPYRRRLEKRLTRYLAWLWRIEKAVPEGISVRALLDGIRMEIDTRNPGRTKERFEIALDRLEEDAVIAGWQYENPDENMVGHRGWWKKWLNWRVIIEPPEEIAEHYKKIKHPKEHQPSFLLNGDRIRDIRRKKGLSLLRAAEQIRISAGSLSKIERGDKVGKKTAEKVKKWLDLHT